MICKNDGFIIQRHNELRDFEADLLSMVCNDASTTRRDRRAVKQRVQLGKGRKTIYARGFWEQHQSHFSIFVSVILMQSHTNSWNQSRFTVYTRTKRRAPTRDVF